MNETRSAACSSVTPVRLIGALLLAVLAGCGGGNGDSSGTPQPQPPPPAPVTQTVGAAGGMISGPNGVTVAIPPDALVSDTQITIAIDAAGAPLLPPVGQGIGPIVSITPHGTTFGVPITVSMPFDPTLLPTGEPVTLIKTNARGDAWQQLVTERNGNTLTAAATSFSWIGVRCCIDPVRIVDQPDDQTAFEGGFAFFRVEAFGRPGDVRYQWFRNGLLLPGETNPEILIPRVTLADDNSLYMARVTVIGVSEDSRAARLLVSPIAPVIVNHPSDEQVVEGRTARFTGASTSSVTQTLRWERQDSSDPDWSFIAGETATVLSFIAQASDDGALFRMCATNSTGTSCSRAASLSVVPLPVQPVITQQPQPITVAAGSSASFTVIATGGGLAHEWQRASDGVNFVPIAGATSATHTISNVQLADDGATLRVRVFNSAGEVLSTAALLTVRLNPGAALTRVLGGNAHSIGLRADGSLRSWGANDDGQLGDGTVEPRSDAVTPLGPTDVATFAVGGDHAVALRANGEVWTWGANDRGQLGDGSTTPRATPQPVAGLGPARAAAANLFAMSRSTVVLADGTVWSWGSNLHGQLGDGTILTRLTPVQAGTLTDAVRVSAGLGFTVALRNDGSVWAWGDNRGGQLGNGSMTASLVPVPIPMPASIAAISAGTTNVLALTSEGDVLAWGLNVAGEVGDGTQERKLVPTPVSLPAPAIAVAAGGNHMLSLLLDGRVFAWGGNGYGQCGNGSPDEYQLMPQQVVAPLPADIVAIGVGINHSLALAADGSVWAWGNNFSGQLNDGTSMNERATPVQALNVNLN